MDYELILKNLGYKLPIKNLEISPVTVTGSTTVLSVTDIITGENSVYVTGKLRGLVHVSGADLIPKIDDGKNREEKKIQSKEEEKISDEAENTSAVEETLNENENLETDEHEQVETNNQKDAEEVEHDIDSTSEFLLKLPDGSIEKVPVNSDISKMNGGVLSMKIKSFKKTYGDDIKILNTAVPEKYKN